MHQAGLLTRVYLSNDFLLCINIYRNVFEKYIKGTTSKLTFIKRSSRFRIIKLLYEAVKYIWYVLGVENIDTCTHHIVYKNILSLCQMQQLRACLMFISKYLLRKRFVTLKMYSLYITCLIMIFICFIFNSWSQSTVIVDKENSFHCLMFVIYLF